MYDKTVFVEILATYAGNANKESFVPFPAFPSPAGLSNAIKMNIQPAGDQMTVLYDGVMGKTFLGFTSASGLAEGMRVTVSGTDQRFMVRGRKNYDYGPLQHSEVVLFKKEPL